MHHQLVRFPFSQNRRGDKTRRRHPPLSSVAFQPHKLGQAPVPRAEGACQAFFLSSTLHVADTSPRHPRPARVNPEYALRRRRALSATSPECPCGLLEDAHMRLLGCGNPWWWWWRLTLDRPSGRWMRLAPLYGPGIPPADRRYALLHVRR